MIKRIAIITGDAFRSLVYKIPPAKIVSTIREFVECESPSDNPAAVNRFVDLAASKMDAIGKVKTFPGGRFGRHLRCEFSLPGAKKSGQILALAHSDTVWPMGTLQTMPFRHAKGRLWGPGVLATNLESHFSCSRCARCASSTSPFRGKWCCRSTPTRRWAANPPARSPKTPPATATPSSCSNPAPALKANSKRRARRRRFHGHGPRPRFPCRRRFFERRQRHPRARPPARTHRRLHRSQTRRHRQSRRRLRWHPHQRRRRRGSRRSGHPHLPAQRRRRAGA